MQKIRALTPLAKIFVLLTIAIFAVLAVLFVSQLKGALAMNPHSFNCLHDSMMSQICHDPYGSSISWALILLLVLGWPAVAAWALLGVVLLVRRKHSAKRSKKLAETALIHNKH